MRRPLALPAVAAGLLLAACAAPNSGTTAPTALPGTPSPPPSPSSNTLSRPPVLSPSPGQDAQAAAVEAARRDAAQRLDLGPEALQVEDVESRQWPDRSLGCPRQGVLYAQIVTPGYLVVVGGAGRHLEYHTDDRGVAVFCQER